MNNLWNTLLWVVFFGLFALVSIGWLYCIILTPYSIAAVVVGVINWFGWTQRTADEVLTLLRWQDILPNMPFLGVNPADVNLLRTLLGDCLASWLVTGAAWVGVKWVGLNNQDIVRCFVLKTSCAL